MPVFLALIFFSLDNGGQKTQNKIKISAFLTCHDFGLLYSTGTW
jgi:hypothetical protein